MLDDLWCPAWLGRLFGGPVGVLDDLWRPAWLRYVGRRFAAGVREGGPGDGACVGRRRAGLGGRVGGLWPAVASEGKRARSGGFLGRRRLGTNVRFFEAVYFVGDGDAKLVAEAYGLLVVQRVVQELDGERAFMFEEAESHLFEPVDLFHQSFGVDVVSSQDEFDRVDVARDAKPRLDGALSERVEKRIVRRTKRQLLVKLSAEAKDHGVVLDLVGEAKTRRVPNVFANLQHVAVASAQEPPDVTRVHVEVIVARGEVQRAAHRALLGVRVRLRGGVVVCEDGEHVVGGGWVVVTGDWCVCVVTGDWCVCVCVCGDW